MSEEKTFWTVHELAAYWGVTAVSIHHHLLRVRIPGATKVEDRWVIDKDVCLAGWMPKAVELWQRKTKMPSLVVKDAGSAREVADEYFKQLALSVPMERWVKIIIKAMDQAEAGDAKARAWLSNNLMGTPVQRVIAEVAINEAIPKDQLTAVLETMLTVARLAREAQAKLLEEDIIDGEAVDVT